MLGKPFRIARFGENPMSISEQDINKDKMRERERERERKRTLVITAAGKFDPSQTRSIVYKDWEGFTA